VGRRDSRPLIAGKDPMDVLRAQAEARYPAYAEAHITVETGEAAHQTAVDAIIKAVKQRTVAAP
jgi:shikimate kinase